MKDHGQLLKGMPPLRVAYGRGGRVTSEEGRDYVDLVCGFGPVSLGHAHPEITEAVIRQLDRGMLFAAESESIERLCSQLVRLVPGAEGCRLAKTGSEAVAMAVRLARACTGRDRVVRCGFHGWHDPFAGPKINWHELDAVDCSDQRSVAGVDVRPGSVSVWDGRTIDDLEEILSGRSEAVAALILDPVQLRPPLRQNLERIVGTVHAAGAVLILDETKTALRLPGGSAQCALGVAADLTVLGKAIANGFPLAAVVGPAAIMKRAGQCGLKGTYNTELVSVAASLATLKIAERDLLAQRLDALGARFIGGLQRTFAESGVPGLECRAYRWNCMPHIVGGKDAVMRFHARAWSGGVLMIPGHMSFVCGGHTEADIDEALGRLQRVLAAEALA